MGNRKDLYAATNKPKPEVTVEATVVVETAPESVEPSPVEEVVEVVAPVEVPAAPKVSITEENALMDSATVSLLKAKLVEFKETYPTNKPMSVGEKQAMLRHMEMCINLVVNSASTSECAQMLTILRTTLNENAGNVFSKARILGNMLDPRSGRLNVQNERTVNLLTLLYTTMSPKVFAAQKGRIDVSYSVRGIPQNAALNIMQYYS